MNITTEWYMNEFINHESAITHRPMEEELAFYDAVANGNLTYVEENCQKKDFINCNGFGVLSENPVQNLKYHFVISATMISRYCIQTGMDVDKALNLNLFYINKLDPLKTVKDISKLHDKMCIDICKMMISSQKLDIESKPVVMCIDYIHKHIKNRITMKELSAELNLSESYISKIFHKEMGVSISQYIKQVKIDKAKNLLQFSEFSINEIASYLSFSSQSHFISVFQKVTGMTPNKYRTNNFRKNWG